MPSEPPLSATELVTLGERFAGKYLVEREIGVGGMGVVVAARHLQLGQTVAIKLLALPPDGACGYPLSFLPTDPTHYYADAPLALFGSGTACGACLRVSSLDGSKHVDVQIIDFSGGGGDKINVEPAAYNMIGGSNPTVNVGFMPCNYGKTIWAQFRGDNDPAVLLYGFTTRATSVAIKGPTGAFRQLSHPSPYWEPPGGFSPGGTTASLELTDELGAVIDVGPLAIDGQWYDTGKQFPTCVLPP